MSKLYNNYLKLKNDNDKKSYLFRSGNFYIFIDKDALKISEITTLKTTNLTNDIVKCGFPKSALDKYMSIFKNLNIDIEIIEEVKEGDDNNKILKKLKSIDINSIAPLKALNILDTLKKMLDE